MLDHDQITRTIYVYRQTVNISAKSKEARQNDFELSTPNIAVKV